MTEKQKIIYNRLTDKQRALVDKCHWCDTNKGDCQTVNDPQWLKNRCKLAEWAAINGYTQEQVSACLVWRRENLQ